MILKGNLVTLRPITKDDLKYVYHWINDPEVQYYSQEEYPFYFSNWAVRCIYKDATKGKMIIFIIENEMKEPIGEIWVHPIDFIRKTAELVIIIGKRENRGRGYGKDTINTIKEFCSKNLRLDSLYLKVFIFNKQAINCYKSCGFKVAGKIPCKVARYGILYDELVMEVSLNNYSFDI